MATTIITSTEAPNQFNVEPVPDRVLISVFDDGSWTTGGCKIVAITEDNLAELREGSELHQLDGWDDAPVVVELELPEEA